MDTHQVVNMPHVVFLNFPMASQVNPMLELAKLLQSSGIYITFVITDSIYRRILRSESCNALEGLSNFRLEIIADGSSSDTEILFSVFDLVPRLKETCADPFNKLLKKLHGSTDVPPITCIISDLLMTFAKDAAEMYGVPLYIFWTTSAADFLACMQVPELIRRGYIPLKDESCLTNGYLDTSIDWIPGMKNIRLKNFSSLVRTTNRDDSLLNYLLDQVDQASNATGVILNSFDQLENDVINAAKHLLPRIYTIGPLTALAKSIEIHPCNLSLSIWKQNTEDCKLWLHTKKDSSVVFVSFGSLKILTSKQLTEFAWGLADSNIPFLWIFRNDLVKGGISALPRDFIEETNGRGLFCNWCNQVEVLSHPSIGAFLTHAGWNSMTESICAGLPMICWPTSIDQFTNSHYACQEFKVGVEIDLEVKREQVKKLVEKVMKGDKSEELKRNAMKWKDAAKEACSKGGSSFDNFKKFIKDLNVN